MGIFTLHPIFITYSTTNALLRHCEPGHCRAWQSRWDLKRPKPMIVLMRLLPNNQPFRFRVETRQRPGLYKISHWPIIKFGKFQHLNKEYFVSNYLSKIFLAFSTKSKSRLLISEPKKSSVFTFVNNSIAFSNVTQINFI